MPSNKVFNEVVIDADDEDIEELVQQLEGVPASELFERLAPAGAGGPLKAWGCTGVKAWRMEPREDGEPLVIHIETENARPVTWVEYALGYELQLLGIEMFSRCPDGGFAGYVAMEREEMVVNQLAETEAVSAEEFFSHCSSDRRWASEHAVPWR